MLNNQRYLPFATIAFTTFLVIAIFHWLFGGFFPATNGNVGDDYSYILPQLIDGYFWSLNNGAFSIQWFTPGTCGGLPAFPNPQNIYYSVPQWLTFFVPPLSAVYLTILLFSGLGFVGTYLLLHKTFQLDRSVAILGGVLFALNGFYSDHLLVGHFTFHSFMLIPLLAFTLLRHVPTTWASHGVSISFAALIMAYMIYSGLISLMVPVLICIIVIALIYQIINGATLIFWFRFAISGLIALAISAAKLTAGLAFMSHFPRSDYPLPGANTLSGLLQILFQGLFLTPNAETVSTTIINTGWQLPRPEFEFGITLIPLLFLLATPLLIWKTRSQLSKTLKQHWFHLLAIILLLMIPLVINLYSPALHPLLKQIPVLKNSSNLLRWLAIFVPVLLLLCCLILQSLVKVMRLRLIIVAIAIPMALVQLATTDRHYYSQQKYSPANIEKAYMHYSQRGMPPTITRNELFVDDQQRIYMPTHRNEIVINGESPMTCYEPLFGYRLEYLPMAPLRPGPVDRIINDHYNFKNPACYVFGDANQCQPGDHFRIDQAKQLKQLVHYRPFNFELPGWQWAANALTLTTLALLLLLWITMIVHWAKQLKTRPHD